MLFSMNTLLNFLFEDNYITKSLEKELFEERRWDFLTCFVQDFKRFSLKTLLGFNDSWVVFLHYQ